MILLNCQNNYVERSSNAAKNVDILTTSVNMLTWLNDLVKHYKYTNHFSDGKSILRLKCQVID